MVISLRRKACHLSQLLSAPLSSVYAQPASDTHGGCTSQTALGNEGSAPSLLLRRIPGKTGTERKGRCSHTANVGALHCMLCEWLHSVAQIARAGRGRIPWKSQSAKAVNFLIVCEWASLEKAGSDFHLPVHLLIAHDY